MTESLIRPRPRRWGWLIPTCVVAVGWSLVSTLGAPGNMAADAEGYRTSYLLGSIAGSIALVFAVMLGVHAIVFLRTSGQELVGRHAPFILGAAVVGALPAIALTVLVASSGPDEARLLAIDDRLTERIEAETLEYNAQYEVLLGGKVLAPETLMRQRGIDQARTNIAAYRELMAANEAFFRSEIEATRAEIETSDVGAFTKGRGLTGFDRNTGRILEELKIIRLLESEILNSWEALLDFLAVRPRIWEAQNGQFSFYRDADLAFFNSHMERIDILADQIEARQAAMRARAGDAAAAREAIRPG